MPPYTGPTRPAQIERVAETRHAARNSQTRLYQKMQRYQLNTRAANNNMADEHPSMPAATADLALMDAAPPPRKRPAQDNHGKKKKAHTKTKTG